MAAKTKAIQCDIAIVGAGLAGLALACMLGTHGFQVVCIDRADPDQKTPADDRATVISYGSRQILEEAGIWNHMRQAPCPIRDIRVLDGHSAALLTFLAQEAGGRDFGWNGLNIDWRRAAQACLNDLPGIRFLAPVTALSFETNEQAAAVTLAPGPHGVERIEAKLLVGADGRSSAVRDWMNVPVRTKDYKQRAVVSIATHENPHNNVAVEHFWPQGPFAILPMMPDENGANRSSIVFTEHGPDEESLLHYGDEAFKAALQLKFPEFYGKIKAVTQRLAFPLTLSHAAGYIGPRCALIADAAHGIHPVAGQGLNLGLRDVKCLADLLKQAKMAGKDIGAADLLKTYERRRRPDNIAMIAFTEGLVHLFSGDKAPVKALRALGLRAASKIRPVRRFLMKQAMGHAGKL